MRWQPSPPEEELWPGDEILAASNKRFGLKAPLERIVATDWVTTALNRDKIGEFQVVVDLACGHSQVVSMRRRNVRCKICQAMIDRGADYEAFRNR